MLPESTESIPQRKLDHISINLKQDVQGRDIRTGFENYNFMHAALPELNLKDVDTSTTVLGHRLQAPILISSMTGGVARGREINQHLARAAQQLGCAMGVGSQRAAIEDPSLSQEFAIRESAPDILLFANLGAVQLNYGYGVTEYRKAVEMIGADAIMLHLNPLQEALQRGGDTNFSGLLSKIEAVCKALDVPVIVKEVGSGISTITARQLADAGVAAIDVSGAGGTSWSAVEHFRAETALMQRLSSTFVDWGIPTAASLRMAREGAPDTPIFASGGMRTGLDAAKAVALGATLAGFAGPLLKAAAIGEEETVGMLTALVEELRLAMFLTGAETIDSLANVPIRDGAEKTARLEDF